jgi:type II secretory pathway pseudopilin PulG
MGYPPPEHRPALRQGLAITSLVLGILSIPSLGCLGIGALLGVVLGIVALVRANREPQVYGGKGFAIGGIAASALSLLVAIPLAGIVAAIAIPSFLRARVVANESAAIADVRTVISAEAVYQSASGGYYGPPPCLAGPTTCLPAYSGPSFLDTDLASATVKNGYRRTFHAGPAVHAPTGTPGIPAQIGSLESFAYTAVPVEPGKTGIRGFCGDSTGRICVTSDGSEPAVTGGACDPGCPDLR